MADDFNNIGLFDFCCAVFLYYDKKNPTGPKIFAQVNEPLLCSHLLIVLNFTCFKGFQLVFRTPNIIIININVVILDFSRSALIVLYRYIPCTLFLQSEREAEKCPKFKKILRTYPRLRKGELPFILDTARNCGNNFILFLDKCFIAYMYSVVRRC